MELKLVTVFVGFLAVAASLVTMWWLRALGSNQDPDIDPKTGHCWRGRCWHGLRVATVEELHNAIERTRLTTGAYDSGQKCWNATQWYEKFGKREVWSWSSQRWEDSVLASLFADTNLGTTNKFVVEFGFDQLGFAAKTGGGSNSEMWRLELGWNGVAFDSEHEVPSDNLYKERITPDSVVDIFAKYEIPTEADYVSIDIDSCDIWVFLNLTAADYRPRVLTVEYNSEFSLEQSKAVRCELTSGEKFSWPALGYGQIFGASLLALHKAAEMRGYTMVYSLFLNDVYLVRSDLVCEGSAVDISKFKNDTGREFWPRNSAKDYAKWVADF